MINQGERSIVRVNELLSGLKKTPSVPNLHSFVQAISEGPLLYKVALPLGNRNSSPADLELAALKTRLQ